MKFQFTCLNADDFLSPLSQVIENLTHVLLKFGGVVHFPLITTDCGMSFKKYKELSFKLITRFEIRTYPALPSTTIF